MMSTRQSWFTFLSVGRLHITAIAALGVFTFGWLFMGEYPWLLALVCGFDWYVVNLINRIVDFEEDEANRIAGADFAIRNKSAILTAVVMVLILSIFLVHFLNPAITWLRIGAHLLGAAYNWPILPGRRRLKRLYFWKNTASAAGFMITLFGYPLATMAWGHGPTEFPPGISWATVLFSGTFFLLFEISYEVIYDLRDVKGDTLAGIKTYPVVHGERVAVHIIDGLMLTSMAVLIAGYAIHVLPWRVFIMIAAPTPQFIAYKRALRRGVSAADCIRLTWLGVAMLFIYHIWVIAELPGSEF